MNEFLRKLRDLMERLARQNMTPAQINTEVKRYVQSQSQLALFSDVHLSAEEFAAKYGASEEQQSEIIDRLSPVLSKAESASKNFKPAVLSAVERGLKEASKRGLEGDYRTFAREALRGVIANANHIETEIHTAQAALDRASTLESSIAAGYEFFRYSGPGGGRKFCAQHVGKVYHISEIREMNNGQGLSVEYNCGGYNCRHRWDSVTPEEARKARPDFTPAKTTAEDVRDEFTKQHWNGKYGKLTMSSFAAQQVKNLFIGTRLEGVTVEDMIKSTGAPDGSEVAAEVVYGKLSLTVTHPWYSKFKRSFAVDKSTGEIIIYNDYMVLDPSKSLPPGVGLRTLAEQVTAARALGVKRLETYAAGDAYDKKYNGYYTWFRYGYNSDLDEVDKINIANYVDKSDVLSNDDVKKFKSAKSILDIFDIGKTGREYWREYGSDHRATFDVDPGSRNSKTLLKYLKEKKVKI